MGKNKINRIKENDLLQVRQNYLSAAISDISGYIHLMDTIDNYGSTRGYNCGIIEHI